MAPRRRRDEEEDDDADAFGSADSQLSGSDVEDAEGEKEPPGLTMQAGGEESKEKEEKEDEETANVDEKDEKDEVEKEAKEKDEAKDNDDEKEDDEKEDEKEEDSKDYADAASHVSEEAQKEAKVPTNSRYFLHDDRRVNEEDKEEKEETSKENSKDANRSGRRNDKGDPDADGKWDHDMYYKLLEEAPRAKAPRVPNESWSTMGRRKPGYGSEDWSWNTKPEIPKARGTWRQDDAWQYEKWEKPAEARHPRRREQNAWDEWKGSEYNTWEDTWEEPKKGKGQKGRGKGNQSWKNDWTQEEEWNEEWNEEWEGEEQGEWIWKPRKGARNAANTTTTRWNQHDDRGARKMQQEEAWWC